MSPGARPEDPLPLPPCVGAVLPGDGSMPVQAEPSVLPGDSPRMIRGTNFRPPSPGRVFFCRASRTGEAPS